MRVQIVAGGSVMQKSRIRLACLLLATPALLSARPATGGSGGTVAADISYVRSLSNGGRQLVVAKDDGSGATTIYSSTRMLSGELGPDGNIYFWEGGRFNRMPATGGAAQTLFDTFRTVVNHSDLSRDGASVAWFSPDAGELLRYDIGSGQQIPLAAVASLIDLTFDYTGNSIVYAEEVTSGVDYELKVIPVTGGTAASLGLTARISSVDSAHRDNTLVLTINDGAGPHVELWKLGMSTPTRIADGYNATYRCDDSAILFDRVTSSGAALYRRSSGGAIALVAKPTAIFPSFKPSC